jgi:hypothetical protein
LWHYAFVLGCVVASRFCTGVRCCITLLYWAALLHHAFVLARIRLTRTAAERGPVLFGVCGQVGVFHNPWHPSAFRVRAPAVSTGSSVSGV